MARLENWINQGYVPTPEIVIELLTQSRNSVLEVKCYHCHSGHHEACRNNGPREMRFLDPCCGDGAALKAIVDNIMTCNEQEIKGFSKQHTIHTVGIEVNEERAEAAKENLSRVIHSDRASVEIKPDSFDFAWVNPPYDYKGDGTGDRVETDFLNDAAMALRENGCMAYVVPDHVAIKDLALFYQWFYNIKVMAFPEHEFAKYSQVIVMGRKREMPIPYTEAQEYSKYTAENLITDTARGLTAIDVIDRGYRFGQALRWNASHSAPRPTGLVRVMPFNLPDLERQVRQDGAFASKQMQRALSGDLQKVMDRPLSPMRKGHVIMAIANGQLNNVVLEQGEERIIIQGSANKVKEVVSDSESKLVQRDKIVTSIKTMDLTTGEVTTIDEGSGDDLANLLTKYWEPIIEYCKEAFKPVVNWQSDECERERNYYSRISRKPVSAQLPTAVVLAKSLSKRRYTLLIGEQGTGKTYLAITAADAANKDTVLVTCPTHAIATWIEEIQMTLPNARIRIVDRVMGGEGPLTVEENEDDQLTMPLNRIRKMTLRPWSPIFVLMSKETAREGHRWAYLQRPVGTKEGDKQLYRARNQLGRVAEKRDDRPVQTMGSSMTCPFCWQFVDQPDRPLRWHHQVRCPSCNAQLAEPELPLLQKGQKEKDLGKARRISGADYVVRRMRSFFDLYICDEVHQMKSSDTAQGEECGRIAQALKTTLAMTGTFMGGKASEMFYLLQRFTEGAFHDQYAYTDEGAFVNNFGRYRYTTTSTNGRPVSVGAVSRRRDGQQTRKSEITGFHPGVLRYVLPHAIFIRREDMLPEKVKPFNCRRCRNESEYGWDDLCFYCRMNPKFETVIIPLDNKQERSVTVTDYINEMGTSITAPVQETADLTQRECYEWLQDRHTQMAKLALKKNSLSGFPEMRQNLMTYPENCWKGATVHVPSALSRDKPVASTISPFDEEMLYPKEERLIELLDWIVNIRKQKVLIYVTHTKARSVIERLDTLLSEHMYVCDVLPDGNAKGRNDWLRKAGAINQIIIASAKSMETGLNCQQFPIIIWYEIHESMYTVDQASARSTRINQLQETEVYFMAYERTLQHAQLSLIASKSDTARRIYGELGQTGLSALNPDDTDLAQVLESRLRQAQDGQGLWDDVLIDETDMNRMMQRQAKVEVDVLDEEWQPVEEEPEIVYHFDEGCGPPVVEVVQEPTGFVAFDSTELPKPKKARQKKRLTVVSVSEPEKPKQLALF